VASRWPGRVASGGVTSSYRIGVDENGLGAWLGPMVVTGVLARAGGRAAALLEGRLPPELVPDLDDSKRLVSHSDVRLGEAWPRGLVDPAARCPEQLFQRLSLDGPAVLRAQCPKRAAVQCWSATGERFSAPERLVERVRGHRDRLAALELEIVAVKSSVICTKRLNQGRARGQSRFLLDLHAMERLLLELRSVAGSDVHAVCGKVGGIGDYTRFFGPLAGRLHVVLMQGPACSAYRFPGLGEVRFVRDADAHDPLVMLASLVGKYLRELLMGRVARHYRAAFGDGAPPSGYHDPRTARFVEAAAPLRRVPLECFERTHEQRS